MRTRWLVALLAVSFVTMALVLEGLHLTPGSLLAVLLRTELIHLLVHTGLYGLLAACLASAWVPASALGQPGRGRAVRALGATVSFALVAVAQELAQAVGRGRLPALESAYDLVVDAAAGALGLILWARHDPLRPPKVAAALGLLLHPGLVGPVGVFAVTFAALRDARAALGWTAAVSVAVLPPVAVWVAGLRGGWYSDRDLSVRRERPSFLAVALVTATLLWVVAGQLVAPEVVRDLALAGLVATALVTAATLGGLKVSGHAAVPVGVLALLATSSLRGLWPFAVVALAVAWARIREGRHTAPEVLAAWCIAAVSGFLPRLGA